MPGRILAGLHHRSPSPFSSSPRSTSREPSISIDSLRLRPHSPASMENLKRHNLSGILSKPGSTSSSKPAPPRNTLTLIRESPPSIFFGAPEDSTGILFAGILHVNVVTEPQIVLSTLTLRLVERLTQAQPVVKNCPECTRQEAEVKLWNFLIEPKTLDQGTHNFPFSHLIDGSNPATSVGKLTRIEYFLVGSAQTTTGETLTLNEELRVLRSLPVQDEKHSIRVFPPTPLTAHLSALPVIHPTGRFHASFALRDLVTPANAPRARKPDTVFRWRLRKLTWKFVEIEQAVAPACDRHAAKLGGPGKGREWKDERTLLKEGVIKGWGSSYSGTDGEITFDFDLCLAEREKACCDVSGPSGIQIHHQIVVAMIVAEEYASLAKPDRWTCSGAARILRCHFSIRVTERAGLGVAWDEENPPLYGDVSGGPPPDYEHEFGLPSLTSEQQAEAARVAGRLPPDSPPSYGSVEELEDILEELDLSDFRRQQEERRWGTEDVEGYEEEGETLERGRTREREEREEAGEAEDESDPMEGSSRVYDADA